MSNENREEVSESHNYGKETVGALLHRERVTRRISVQRVAEDLKFNEEYLVAIEESRYKDLPAIPYVRVYIRTIAQYLSLDGEELLERFAKEMQVEFPDPEKERHDTMRISIQNEKKGINWIGPLIGLAIVVVVVVVYIQITNNRMKAEENSIEVPTEKVDTAGDTTTQQVVDTISEVENKTTAPVVVPQVVDTTPKESVLSDEAEVTGSSDDTAQLVSEIEKVTDTISIYPLDSLKLTIGIEKDSSVVQVIKGGVKVFNSIITAGNSKTFSGTDPIYVKVGRNGVVSYSLNGKPVVAQGGGWTAYAKFTCEKGYHKSNSTEWRDAR